MTPFTYTRAADVDGAIKAAGRAGQARYLGGGTNLIDLMRESIEKPEALVDVTGVAAGDRRACGWRHGHWGCREEHRGGGGFDGAAAVSAAFARHSFRRQRADSEYGDGGREYSAAHALFVFL